MLDIYIYVLAERASLLQCPMRAHTTTVSLTLASLSKELVHVHNMIMLTVCAGNIYYIQYIYSDEVSKNTGMYIRIYIYPCVHHQSGWGF